MEKKLTATEIWDKYQAGVDHHRKNFLYTKVDKCHRFYEGDQWRDQHGSIGEDLPVYNIIETIVNYKASMIAQNSMVIVYSPHEGREGEQEVCDLLNAHAEKKWDKLKMDGVLWDAVKEAAITGDSFLYFFDDSLRCQMVDSDSVFLGDEQQQDIQKQPYIILYERRLVSDVREDARNGGMDEEEVMQIVPDDESVNYLAHDEVKTQAAEKCSVLRYISKDEQGNVQFCECTKTVMLKEMASIEGMTHYPIAKYTWKRQFRSSRGVGEVLRLIPNQVEINKTLYRRLEAMKAVAFPKPVYVEGLIENPDNITTVGSPVRVREGSVQKVQEVFTYLQPAQMSGDAKALQDEMLETTRELANAGDNALGNINPEQASGAAIVAVKDAQAVPLNEQKAAAKQFVEDIAIIWLDTLTAYNANGLQTEQGVITGEMLEGFEPEIRIDVSDGNPFSIMNKIQQLENALAAGYITFEEFTEHLPETGHTAKGEFEDILKEREAQMMAQMMPQMNSSMMPMV